MKKENLNKIYMMLRKTYIDLKYKFKISNNLYNLMMKN